MQKVILKKFNRWFFGWTVFLFKNYIFLVNIQWVEDMADAGINHYTFHIEATDDVMGCIRKIREAGMKVGQFTYQGTPSIS